MKSSSKKPTLPSTTCSTPFKRESSIVPPRNALDQLEATRDELENKIAAEKLAKPRITEEQLRFFLDRFRKLDVRQLSHRRMLIDTFINAVFLYDDKLVLTYNFREETETITFDDLKNKLREGFSGSDMSSVAAPNLKTVLCAVWLCTGRFFIKILPGNPPILSQLGIFIFPPHLEGRISTRLRRIFLGNIEPLIDKALSLQCVFVDKYLPVRTRNRLGTG